MDNTPFEDSSLKSLPLSYYSRSVIKLETIMLEYSLCAGSTELRSGSNTDEYVPQIEQWDSDLGWLESKDFEL